MGRILPTLVVLALLGCTAAAFAVTENLKLERSPISDTHVSKVVAPDSLSNRTAAIGFLLRKPDRLTVEIVNGSGDVVRTLASGQAARGGTQQFIWDGRDDAHEVVPDATYRPRVHLAREHRTILMPNPIRMDATPPLIRLVSVTPRVFSPDGDFRRELVRIKYQTNEKARAFLYVDGDSKTRVKRYLRAGKFDWGGRSARYLKPGVHRIRLRAFDLATNLGPPSRALTVVVRYVDRYVDRAGELQETWLVTDRLDGWTCRPSRSRWPAATAGRSSCSSAGSSACWGCATCCSRGRSGSTSIAPPTR